MPQKLSKKARFRKEHPYCCFCGGTRPSTTLDHVPPKACFPVGFWPDEFEFPSCNQCNNGTSKHDTIFGFYSMLLDFNEANRTPGDRARIKQLHAEILKRYPDALPDLETGEPIYKVGHIITPSPVAIVVDAKPAAREAMVMTGEKLTHALYYREMKGIITPDHRFFTSKYQIQRDGTETLTSFFKGLLPDTKIGNRSNIKKYGSRFAYMFGCKQEEEFFVFAAQFGYGLLIWGMVLGPTMALSGSDDALQNMDWKAGGCGLGSAKTRALQKSQSRGR
jgi:hypothetical protein